MGQKTSKQPEYWEKDGEHTQCQLCDTKFSLVRRRHHCRSCGGVFCAACTSRTALVPVRGFDEPVRVCDRCKLREGGVPNLPNAMTGGTSRSSTGGGAPQRSRSMDVHGYGIGAATEGNYRSATPRAASSLAIIENSSRNRGGATTPRYSGLGGPPTHSTTNAGRPPLVPPQRGQFLNERRSNNSNSASASPSSNLGNNNNNNANNSAYSVPNNNNKVAAPTPSRYRQAVLLLLFSRTSPFGKFGDLLFSSSNGPKNSKQQSPAAVEVIGSLLIEFLKQPSSWFDRACIQTHKMSLLGDPYQDWSSLTVVSRQPSGFSAGVVAKSTTSGINSSPQIAPALFLAAPTLPSTRSTTLYLSLKLVSSSSSSTSSTLTSPTTIPQFMDLSILRSLQVGIAHESSMSSRTRALPTPAVSFTVDSLSTQRVPAIGVSLEGKCFSGSKVDDSESFRLNPDQEVKAIVVAVSFDQTSGSVAFSMMNATPLLMSMNKKNNFANSSRNLLVRKSSPNLNNNNSNGNGVAGETNTHNLPVLAAFPCSLPSGVAGKWFAAFSLDTTQLVDGCQLMAEWL